MKEFSKIGDHYVKDAQARADIETLNTKVETLKEGVEDIPTETWTFTLEDGTSVTKNVAVKG